MIILNFFLGLIFFKPAVWLLIGVILVLLFTINSYFMARRIINPPHKKSRIIDIEAKVIEKED